MVPSYSEICLARYSSVSPKLGSCLAINYRIIAMSHGFAVEHPFTRYDSLTPCEALIVVSGCQSVVVQLIHAIPHCCGVECKQSFESFSEGLENGPLKLTVEKSESTV